MTPREIALSICEPWFNGDPCDKCECHKVCTKLVERIETAIRAERVPETNFGTIPQLVAYISGYHKGRCIIEAVDRNVLLPVGMALYRSPPNQSEDALGMVEPVAYCTLEQLAHLKLAVPSEDKIAIYTAPPKREPLTDEEIESLVDEFLWNLADIESFARAVERAHGIGGEE